MLGKRLSETRKEKGFSAQQMADMLDITIGAYRFYENGKARPTLDKLVRIADILEVTTDYLLCREEKEE